MSKEELVGAAIMLMLESKPHRRCTLAYGAKVLHEAVRQHNIKFFFGNDGALVAFAVWAYVDLITIERLTATPSRPLLAPEWNEGSELWMVDLIAPYGNVRSVWRDLRSTVFVNESEVRFVSGSNNGSLVHKQFRRNIWN